MNAFFDSVVVFVIISTVLNYCLVFAAMPPEFATKLRECAGQHNTKQNDMVNSVIKPASFPKDAFKCAWACTFKKLKLLDNNGMYDVNAAIENIKKLSKASKVQEGVEAVKRCGNINDKPVTDGANGCDRAQLLIDCLAKDLIK